MGRPPKFDRDTALKKATELFWKQGYANTSVAQLQKAMKIGEGSFYNAFKSKKGLFLECLKHYNATFMARRSAALNGERSARQKVEDFFDVVIDELSTNKAPGCLVTNSLTAEVLGDRKLKGYLFDSFDRFLPHMAGLVAEGQASGEVRATGSPEALARVLFTYLHGLHRLSVYDRDFEARRAETRTFIASVLGAT